MLQFTASYNISEIIKEEGYTRGYISQAAGMFLLLPLVLSHRISMDTSVG